MSKNEISLKKLKTIIGDNLFLEVCKKMPGDTIYIPNSHISKAERNKAIRFDFYDGLAFPQIAKKYNLSVSQVYKIIESRD